MNKDLVAIFEYLGRKGIKRDIIIAAVEESLRAAARKSVKGLLNVSVHINAKTGNIDIIAQKEMIDKVTIPDEEISLEDARVLNPYCEIGQWVDIAVTPQDFGRIAAQTARQVIAQKLRTAERDVIYEEYRHRINEIISGTVKRTIRGATLIVDLGKVEAIMPDRFYPKTEKYNVGDRVQALLLEVRDTESGGGNSFYQEAILSLSLSYSSRKSLKSTTARSPLRKSSETPATAQKSPCVPKTRRWIPSAPVSASAATASRTLSAS